MSAEAPSTKELMFSPLKRWRKQHCNQCGSNCVIDSPSFKLCLLADLVDSIKRNNELNKLRGAHL